MPITRVSCIVCGNSIEDAASQPEWMARFRAIYVTDGEPSSTAHISGVGSREQFFDAILDDSVAQGDDEGDYRSTILDIDLMCTKFGGPSLAIPPVTSPRVWGFPFHTSCWDIMGNLPLQYHGDTQAVMNLCLSFPAQIGILNWGHDYGGLVQSQIAPSELNPGEELWFLGHADLETQRHDPFDIPALRNIFEHEAGSDAVPGYPESLPSRRGTDTKGPFLGLPAEILELILLQLPSADVVRLRQASWAFANVALSDMFWRSRFWPGREFETVFESTRNFQSHRRHWRQLYISTKHLRGHPAPENRRRIWELASSLQGLLGKMSSVCCGGDPVRSFLEPNAPLDARQWITASRALKKPEQCFTNGSRVLYERVLDIPDDVAAIFVSQVAICGRQHIGGIRFLQRNGNSITLGYCYPQTEISLISCEHGSCRTVGFHLAQDQRGIRGLAALSDADMPASRWAGEHQDIPKRRLALNNMDGDTKIALKGGFDALKLVSLSISHQSLGPTELVSKPGLRDTALWFPEIPDPCLLFRGVEPFRTPDAQQDLPINLCIFGGNDGQYLQYVLGITVWNGQYDVLLDLEVSLSTGYKPGRLGQRKSESNDKTEMVLDGPGGERIIGLDAFYTEAGWFMGFQIRTNRDRTAMFPPSLSSDPSLGEWDKKSLSSAGLILVGFCVMSSQQRGFSDIGIICVASAAE